MQTLVFRPFLAREERDGMPPRSAAPAIAFGCATRRVVALIAGLAILAAVMIPILLTVMVALPALLIAMPLVAIAAVVGGNPRDPIAPEPPRVADLLSYPARVAESRRAEMRPSRAAA